MLVHVDLFCGGGLGQAGHGHDVAGEGDDETRPGTDLQAAYGDGEVLRRAQKGGVIGEGILGLGHADGKVPKAQGLQLGGLLLAARVRVTPLPR